MKAKTDRRMRASDFMADIEDECKRIITMQKVLDMPLPPMIDRRVNPLRGERRAFNVPYYTVQLLRDGGTKAKEKSVDHPSVIADHLRSLIGDAPQEHLWVFLLDRHNRMIGDCEISVGTIDATFADPADILRPVINSPAAAFVIAHNHPSGDPTPSSTDKQTHQNILEAARIFKKPMMDAIIIGNGNSRYYSAASSYDLK